MMRPIVRLGALSSALAALLVLTPARAPGQTVTANLRGRVAAADGSPVASATVTATNVETGVARSTLTDGEGRYRLIGLSLGRYRIRAQGIGHKPVEKTGYRLQVGDEQIVDFQLEATAVEVSAIEVVAEQAPLIDPSKAGLAVRVTQDQVENLPANGRNFIDFLALAPGVTVTPNFGAGGHVSIGGGRASGTAIQIDGVTATGTFFGGDARGFERQPIAQTIEAVKEFQVITNDYDVTKGGFTGGLVNAVTKAGTNEFHGSVFEFYRNQNLTAVDFLGVPPSSFRSHQFGGSVGGPIIRNRLHFFAALDRQDRTSPRSNLDNSTPAAAQSLGIAETTLVKIDSIMRSDIYGIDPGTRGSHLAQVNEWAVFGRLDWAISEDHRLTLRNNYTKLSLTNDRLVATDYTSNGGPVPSETNALVLHLFSNFGRSLFNELRVQQAYDDKPRPPNPVCTTAATPACGGMPQVRINVGGRFVALGSDSIVHANYLSEKTLQFVDHVTYNRGRHSFLAGGDAIRYKFYNLFFNNSLGTWTWNPTCPYPSGDPRCGRDSIVLNRLRSRTPTVFTRSIPIGGVTPDADYRAWQIAFFAQDRWQVNDRLLLNLGVRVDDAVFPDTARANPALLTPFPDANTSRKLTVPLIISPRVGLTYDVSGDQQTVVRGGVGRFVGYAPYVLWSNAFLNTGQDQTFVICSGAGNVPSPDFPAHIADRATIPSGCATPGSPPVPGVNYFSEDFRLPYSVKGNLGFDHAVSERITLGAELSYAEMRDNYTVRDINLLTTPTAVLAGEGGRTVVGTAPATGSSARRVTTAFGQVIEHDNRGEGDYLSFALNLRVLLPGNIDLTGSYQYSRARDDFSTPCCITFSMYNSAQAATLPSNELGQNFSPSDFDRAHAAVVSLVRRTASGGSVGLIGRYSSGLPYSPVISSSVDANGDGTRGNDRVYIPRSALDITLQTPAQYAVLDSIINRHDCLAEQRGRIAGRNSCRNEGRFMVDLHVSQPIARYRGQSIELIADFFNVLNGINRKWGKATRVDVPSGHQGPPLLEITGFDAVNNRYIYRVLTTYGRKAIEPGSDLAQFQLQLGVRYRF